MAKNVADYQTAFQNFMEKGARYYACPTGTMLPFAGKTVPAGFLLCNGAAISRTTYARLFSVLGTTWGAGDGSTTFNLPNVNDRCLEGTTNTANVGKYLEAGLPDITGQLHAADGATNMAYPLGFDVQTIGAISVAKNSSWMNKYAGAFNKNNGSVAIFTASASNKYYGESTWVQPASFYTLTIIKI